MTKQEVRRSIEERYGAFINVGEVAEYLGVDRSTARAYLHGLTYLPNGKEKKYFVGDVSQRLMERITT